LSVKLLKIVVLSHIIYSSTASTVERLMHMPRVRKVWSSNTKPAEYFTVLQMVRHCFNIYASSCIAL